MKLATFYRGIAVSPERLDTVVSSIRNEGLDGDRFWKREFYRLPLPADVLLGQMPIPKESLRIGSPIDGVYATSDRETALFYALKHNRTLEKTASILIEFECPLEDALVDGRDLLYAAASAIPRPDLRAFLLEVFGEAFEPYLKAAWDSDEAYERIAIIDLAVHDAGVIRAHHANAVTFRGRNDIPFRSAFIVPISSCRIVSVQSVEGYVAPGSVVDAMAMITMRVSR